MIPRKKFNTSFQEKYKSWVRSYFSNVLNSMNTSYFSNGLRYQDETKRDFNDMVSSNSRMNFTEKIFNFFPLFFTITKPKQFNNLFL